MEPFTFSKDVSRTVQELLPGARVLLFGSRARGIFNAASDYDLLIITPAEHSPKEKSKLMGQLDRALVRLLHAPVDIFVKSETEIKRKQHLNGHIIRQAMEEGILL